MTHLLQAQASYIAEIEAWTGAAVDTLRIGTHSFSTRPIDIPPNVSFLGVISDIGVIDRSVFQGSTISGNPQISEGYLEMINTGDLDEWLNYGFDGRTFSVSRLDAASLYSLRRTMFTGTLIGLDASNAWTTLRLRIRDRLKELDLPLLTVRYAGTTLSSGPTIEGNADLKDQIKPWVLGHVRNITPKLVNPYNLIYQVSDHAVNSISVKVGGQALTSYGDMITLEALHAAIIPIAQYATCTSCGVFRMGASPASVVTCDVEEGATSADRTVAQIALRMLEEFGVTDIDMDSIDDADGFNSAVAGIYVDSDETALSLISKMLDSAGFALIPDLEGTFSVVAFRDPSTLSPIAEFDLNDVRDGASISILGGIDEQSVPAYSIVLNYDRNYTPMDQSQLAGILTGDQITNLTEEKKSTVARDLTVQTAHLLAVELTKDTYFASTTDATAEATRLLNLLKVRRDRISVTVTDVEADDVDLGDCVLFTLNRFGFDLGKKFIVLGKMNQFRTRTVELKLWG